jgi:hypothetical protein
MQLKVHELACILAEEFEADGWGDIDPYLFEVAAYPENHPEEECECEEACSDGCPGTIFKNDREGMQLVLARVCERLKAYETASST